MYVRPDLSEGTAHGAAPRWCAAAQGKGHPEHLVHAQHGPRGCRQQKGARPGAVNHIKSS